MTDVLSSDLIQKLMDVYIKTKGDKKDLTYQLNIVNNIVAKVKDKFPNINVTINYSRPAVFTYTAIQLKFTDTEYFVSIQTHPDVASTALCETAILDKNDIQYIRSLGYDCDVIRHYTEKEFEDHLIMLFEKLPTYDKNNIADSSDNETTADKNSRK